MAVNTTEITNVYNTLMSTMTAKYAAMWTANEIDAETYAQLVGQASSQLITLSSELVQKQEQIDKDLDVKERQMVEAEATGDKQRILLDTEEQLKQFEYDHIQPETLTKIQEEIDLLQSQDANELAKKDLELLKTILGTWAGLYGSSKITNSADPVSTINIEAVFDRLNV